MKTPLSGMITHVRARIRELLHRFRGDRLLAHDGHTYTFTLYSFALLVLTYVTLCVFREMNACLDVRSEFAFKALLFLVVLFDAGSVIYWVFRYLRKHLFDAPMERVDRLMERAPQHLRDAWATCWKSDATEALRIIQETATELTLTTEHLPLMGRVAVGLVFCFLRILVGFSLATGALMLLASMAPVSGAAFGTYVPSIHTILDVLNVLERSVYTVLVTITTTGFGDYSAMTRAARIITDMEMFSSALMLLGCMNLSMGILLENSTLAWSGRRSQIIELMKRSVDVKRNLADKTPLQWP